MRKSNSWAVFSVGVTLCYPITSRRETAKRDEAAGRSFMGNKKYLFSSHLLDLSYD